MSQQPEGLGAERRRYFRVADEIGLEYGLISPDQLSKRLARLDQGLEEPFTLISSLAAITQQSRAAFRQIEQTQPSVAECLRALERKMDLLAQALLFRDLEGAGKPFHKVNVSAVGIAFSSETPVDVGAVLEIKMLLFPTFTGILSYGEVVACRHEPVADAAYPYTIAVDFSHIREGDRDLLINHIVKRQHAALRNQRFAESVVDPETNP